MKSSEQQTPFYMVREHTKNTCGRKADCYRRQLQQNHWLNLHRKWACLCHQHQTAKYASIQDNAVHTLYNTDHETKD
jgi:hypothetical protein